MIVGDGEVVLGAGACDCRCLGIGGGEESLPGDEEGKMPRTCLAGTQLGIPSCHTRSSGPRPPLPTPGAAPIVERRAPATERTDKPATKHARPATAQPLDDAAAEVHPESYGEPVILPAVEPAL